MPDHYGIVVESESKMDAIIKLVGKRVDTVNGKRWITLYPDISIRSLCDDALYSDIFIHSPHDDLEIEKGPNGETIWVDDEYNTPYLEVDGASISLCEYSIVINAPNNTTNDDDLFRFMMLRRNLIDEGRIPKSSYYGTDTDGVVYMS